MKGVSRLFMKRIKITLNIVLSLAIDLSANEIKGFSRVTYDVFIY